MKIYISGKMTGLPDLGRQHFENTARMLSDAGHIVLNPGALPVGLEGNQYMPRRLKSLYGISSRPKGRPRRSNRRFERRACLAMLEAADAIYMLHNWADSPGASLERAYAAYQGKDVYYEADVKDQEKLFTRKG